MRTSPFLLGLLAIAACAGPGAVDTKPAFAAVPASWSPGRLVRLEARDAETGEPIGAAVFSELVRSRAERAETEGLFEQIPSHAGRVEVPVSRGRDAWILVEAPGYLPVGVHATGGVEEAVPLLLQRMQTADVQILVNGRPAGPAELRWTLHPELVQPETTLPPGLDPWIEPWGSFGLPFLDGTIRTDENGLARLPIAPVEGYDFDRLELRVDGPEGLGKIFRVISPALLGEDALRLEMLPGTARVTFEVTGPDGWPLPGAQVRCEFEVEAPYEFILEDWEEGDVWDLKRLATNHRGRLDLRVPAPVRLHYQVSCPGWPVERGELRIRPGKAHVLKVELEDAAPGKRLVVAR